MNYSNVLPILHRFRIVAGFQLKQLSHLYSGRNWGIFP